MAVALSAAQPAAATPLLSLDGILAGAVGDTVSADLTLHLDSGDILSAADFTVEYGTKLEFVGATNLYEQINPFSSLSEPVVGVFDFGGSPLVTLLTTWEDLSGPSATTLASLSFRVQPGAVAGDSLPLTLGNATVYGSDANGDPFGAPDITNNQVTVTGGAPVPEPATMLLLGSGLSALVGGRSLRRRSKVPAQM